MARRFSNKKGIEVKKKGVFKQTKAGKEVVKKQKQNTKARQRNKETNG